MGAWHIRYIAKSKIVEHPSNLKLNSASHIRTEGSSHKPIWRSRGSVELPWYIYIYDTKRIAIRRERECGGKRKEMVHKCIRCCRLYKNGCEGMTFQTL